MRRATTKAPRAAVRAWEDDPKSGGKPITRTGPQLGTAPLALAITGPAVPAKLYAPGTRGFRYWTAAEALRRAADFWGALLPRGTSWQPGRTLRVTLDAGVDLNAYYDRRGLSFFHDTVGKTTVYSGESPDVVCHELGHAVLDALRPELWDAMSVEVAAFHESFGDISALLAGLQLPSLRRAVLAETGARIGRSSRLSRLAEQLGWALRQILPGSAEPDCLRNAVNPFFYRAPETLPPSGPSSSLTAEPHSFSRVFTGGWFEALAGMLASRASAPTEADLLQVSLDAGRLLVDAIPAAPIVADYYSQVAAHLIESDAVLFRGRYRDALKSALVRRGILSLQTASVVTAPGTTARARRTRTAAAAGGETQTRRLSLSADEFGLEGRALVVEAPGEVRRFEVASAAEDLGSRTAPAPEHEARRFVEYLFRRGRVDLGAHGRAETRVAHPFARKTHALVAQAEDLSLVRRTFDCGFDPTS
ncbi:MAG: hypothetical protein DMD98_13105 [Candidatus Rokuibacteriota bacterium]|nr:MAG: hypothetical protein DMD98_13105 [Candidatus Rokubacteria bacterium]